MVVLRKEIPRVGKNDELLTRQEKYIRSVLFARSGPPQDISLGGGGKRTAETLRHPQFQICSCLTATENT